MRLKSLFASVAGLALCAGIAAVAEAREVAALADLEGSGEDGYWEYYEVTDEATLAAFQANVGKPGEAMANPPSEPIKIAFIYPSQDVSDFWLRNYQAMMKRLEEMGIPPRTRSTPRTSATTSSRRPTRIRSSRRISITSSSVRPNCGYSRTTSSG